MRVKGKLNSVRSVLEMKGGKDFLEVFSSVSTWDHDLLTMAETCKKAIDYGKEYTVLLTDLSKALDCPVHDLVIAKRHAYGFFIESFYLMEHNVLK